MARTILLTLALFLLGALAAPAGGLAQDRSAPSPAATPAPPPAASTPPAAAPPPSPSPSPAAGEAPKAEASPGVETSPLALQDCLRQTLENNLDIAVHRYDPLRSEAAVTVSVAAFDPALTGTASRTQYTDPRTSAFFRSDRTNDYVAAFTDPLVTGGSYKLQVEATDDRPVTVLSSALPEFTTFWQASIMQPLLRNLGPKTNRWMIVTARNNLGISASQFRQTVLDTLAAAEKAYWDLDFALMDLQTNRSALQLAQDFLDQNRIKVRVGTLAPIEITQAEAGVADREEAVIVSENTVRTAEDALRRVMNVPRDSPLWSRPIQPTDAPPLVESAPDLNEAVETAEKRRPDLEQARLDLANKETALAYRKNQKRWGLDLSGYYGRKGFSQDEVDPLTGAVTHGNYGRALVDIDQGNKEDWGATLALSVPIGNRLADANYTSADYALSQSRFTLQNLEQSARVEVRNAARAVETNLKRVKAAQVNTRLQKEKLAAEQKKFENGMSTSFQVLSFQNDLTSAESRENSAIVDYNKSLVDLEHSKGTLLEARKVVVPGTTGEAPSGGPSAALRSLWHRDLTDDTVTLRLPPVEAGALRLPADFTFAGPRSRAAGGR